MATASRCGRREPARPGERDQLGVRDRPASGLTARPLLYGLMMFTRMLGAEARLVRPHLSAARSLNLSAWAVRVAQATSSTCC